MSNKLFRVKIGYDIVVAAESAGESDRLARLELGSGGLDNQKAEVSVNGPISEVGMPIDWNTSCVPFGDNPGEKSIDWFLESRSEVTFRISAGDRDMQKIRDHMRRVLSDFDVSHGIEVQETVGGSDE